MIKLLNVKETETISNTAKEYYGKNKKRLRKKARTKYKDLTEGEKQIKRKYGRNRYHNMSEENKQRLK